MCETLLTVIYEVPRILDFVPGCCLKLLLQTNREMHQEVHSFVKTISADHVALLTQQDWPSLRKLELRPSLLDAAAVSQLVTATFPHLERLHLADAQVDPGALSPLCNASWPSLQALRLVSLDAAGMADLTRCTWPQLKELTVQTNAAGVAFLEYTNWPHLESLDLLNSKLDAEFVQTLVRAKWLQLHNLKLTCHSTPTWSIGHLSAGSWPELRKLALAHIVGSIRGVMQQLVRGDWPQLESLSLANMQLDGEGVSVLVTSNWRGLTCLDIGENHIASADLSELAKAGWQLKSLCLMKSDFGGFVGSSGLTGLVACKWAQLQEVNLSDCGLECSAMLTEAEANWSALLRIDISSNDIGAKGLKTLLQAKWPLLESLRMSRCELDIEAACYLVQGNLPSLTALDVSENEFYTLDVVRLITLGKWPLLTILDISVNDFERSNGLPLRWSTFGVANDQVVKRRVHRFDCGGKLRFAGQFAYGQWPKLATLDLHSFYSSRLVCW